MSTQPKKEILDYDFPQGISLIEANAGTGKTFSIELIYLKALLELKLEVQQILDYFYCGSNKRRCFVLIQ